MTAKTAQFTQGPWVVKSTDEDINTKTIIDSDEFWIAKVLNFNRASDDIRESQANANLIAAAPAMYAIIKDMREAFYVKGTRKALLEVMERSKNVLAQAEGRHHE